MKKGTQKVLGRVRSPRVHISYDVEIGAESVKKELPFVVGVLADLSGAHGIKDGRLRDRKFVEIDSENFSKVMTALAPTVRLNVPNRISGNGSVMVDLRFSELDSFSPGAVASAVPQLRQLLDTRAKLNDLLAKLEGNDQLNDLLSEVVLDSAVQAAARAAADVKAGAEGLPTDNGGSA